MAPEVPEVEDDEILYRRIPTQPSYYDPEKSPRPSPLAFKPVQRDKDGLSVSRARFRSPEEVAQNPRGKKYYVAVLRVSALRARGIDVTKDPIPPDDLGHALLPGLTWDNRKSDRSEEMKVLLAQELTEEILGPF